MATNNLVTTPSSIVQVTSVIDLNGGYVTFNQGDIIEFREGMYKNGTLYFCKNKIVGRGRIFGDNLTFVGDLDEFALRAEWFGATEMSDITGCLNAAIQCCYSTRVRNILLNRGYYNVYGEVAIGENSSATDEAEIFWDINLLGAGSNMRNGTVFVMGPNGLFSVNMNNTSNGNYRGGSINHCCFMGSSTSNVGKGILLTYGQCFLIHDCKFVHLEKAIQLTASTYYTHIDACVFNACTNAILSDSNGNANDNIISDCMFTYCNTPLKIYEGTGGWHISDCDFEGYNGTCYLGSDNRMTNVRIERNIDNVPWLICNNSCTVSGEIHGCGQNTQTWKCIIEGDNNQFDLHFYTYTPLGFLSYGRGNRFNIVTEQGDDAGYGPTIMIYDPEDTLVVNGFSNKEDYDGENLIISDTFQIDLDDTKKIAYRNGFTYPLVFLSSPLIYNLTYDNPRPTKELYITGKLFIDTESSNISLDLFSMTLSMSSHRKKWYGIMAAAKRRSNIPDGIIPSTGFQVILSNENIPLHLIDLVVSQKPLFERPVLAVPDLTPRPYDSDDIIHFRKTFLNHVTRTFCFRNRTVQKYYSSFYDKFYIFKNGKYFSNGNELSSNCGASVTITSGTNLIGLISGLLKADVTIIDPKTGDTLRVVFTRSSTNLVFAYTVLASTGPVYISNNQYGTVAVSGFPHNDLVAWIEILP